MGRTRIDDASARRLDRLLGRVYGPRAVQARGMLDEVLLRRAPGLEALTEAAGYSRRATAGSRFTEKDALLIAYGDMVGPPAGTAGDSQTALARLDATIERHIAGLFDYLHILPFFPYSSDDGFSVMDYRSVDTDLGTWADIEALGRHHRLVFDLVLNHTSAQGAWFDAFKAGTAPFNRYFMTRPLDYDAATVLRPRTHPLITPVRLDDGRTVGVWTTFSADQVDLDFSEPAVLAEFVDISLAYAMRGARMLRLDAIAYLWKQDGTSCAHLPQTHAIVRILRTIFDGIGLDMAILTETNVPHEQNMSYFGDAEFGEEAHLVYNFSLPPLVLHAFVSGDAGPLSRWAARLRVPAGGTMLNFLASHDGVGLSPARGLIDDLSPTIAAIEERGGLVSYKASPDGPVPYELNVSWADAIARADAKDQERAPALIASYAIACAMDGIPAVYFHSVMGSRNWTDGVRLRGYNRAINRERPAVDTLERELSRPGSLRSLALTGFASLLRRRSAMPAFAPASPRRAFEGEGPVFAVQRGEVSGAVLVLVNCSREPATARVPESWRGTCALVDPVCGHEPDRRAVAAGLPLPGYAVRWLRRIG